MKHPEHKISVYADWEFMLDAQLMKRQINSSKKWNFKSFGSHKIHTLIFRMLCSDE